MTVKKTVVLLVHGAWHKPLHYKAITEPLRSDYEVVMPENVTAGPDEQIKGKTHLDDVEVIKAALMPLLEEGREVVVVAHSYGGIVATDAVVGQTVAERRAQDLHGGVKGLVYIAAIVPPVKGSSLMDGIADKQPDWWEVQGELAITKKEKASLAFYGSETDWVARQWALEHTTNQSMASFESQTQHGSAEVQAKLAFVMCEEDICVPFAAQQMFAAAMGDRVKKISLKTGHSPFMKENGAKVIMDTIRELAEA